MKIGLVTIGQTPRVDVVPEMQDILSGVEIVEAGALDGFTPAQVRTLQPVADDYILVTRLRDGTEVRIAKRHILPRLQQCIGDLENRGVDVIGLLCTGTFPDFACRVPLLKPQVLLYNLVRGIDCPGRLGVLTPSVTQIPQTLHKWQEVRAAVVVEAVSPYGEPEALERAGKRLGNAGVSLVVMDCIGYSEAMKARLKTLTAVPVILAHGLMARVMQELL